MPFNLPFPLTLYITGGVGLALCVVSIVLIAIFHANYKPKRIPLIMFAVGFLLFMGTGFLFWHINHLPDEEDVPIPEPVGTSVDSGLLSVSVTIPAYLLRDEDFSDFDPEEYAEKKGYKKATLNEDGSLTIKISKGDHKEKVAELLAKLEEDFAGLVGGENTPYVKFVEKTPDYHEIIITVDGEGYKEDGDATPVKVGESVVTYQVYNGDYLHSEIKVIDVKTGNTLYDAVFPDALEPGYTGTPANSPAPVEPESVSASSGTLGNYYVEIKDASIVTDYDGNPAIVITYEWTNNGEETVSAEDVLARAAFQDGTPLDDAYIGDVALYDSELLYRELDPGETFDVQCAFTLASDSAIVEFELSELAGSLGSFVAADFDPSTLG